MSNHKPKLEITWIGAKNLPKPKPLVSVDEGAGPYHVHRRNVKRRELFDAQDAFDKRREALIAQIEAKLTQSIHTATIVSIRWGLA